MSKRTDKRIGNAAAAVAAMIVLAACNPDAAREDAFAAPASRQAGLVANDDLSRHAAIERRHFDVYDHFRKLSDQQEVGGGGRPQDDEGVRQALMTMNGFGLDLMPACSMRALLTGD